MDDRWVEQVYDDAMWNDIEWVDATTINDHVRRKIAANVDQPERAERDDTQERGDDGSGRVTVWQVRIGRVPLLLVNVLGTIVLLLGMLGVDTVVGVWWVWIGLLVVNGMYVWGRVKDAARKVRVDGVVSRRVYHRQARRRQVHADE